MNEPAFFKLKYSVHELDVQVACQIPSLLDPISQVLRDLDVATFSGKSSPITGIVRPFTQEDVLRHLSPTATRFTTESDLGELYEEGERFWLIDDHWGLCELNILKSQWRSWVLESPLADPVRVAEQAILWPIAQLLRPRGLCIIPAAAVTRDGWSTLILSSFRMEPELTALVRAGYRVIGQNWTALRHEHGHIEMLAMPGSVERTTPRSPGSAVINPTQRIDLTSEFCGSGCESAICNAVMLIAPGRRSVSEVRPISAANAVSAIRRAWTIAELHPQRRHGHFAAKLAQRCPAFDVHLSHDPQDILGLIDSAKSGTDRPKSRVA